MLSDISTHNSPRPWQHDGGTSLRLVATSAACEQQRLPRQDLPHLGLHTTTALWTMWVDGLMICRTDRGRSRAIVLSIRPKGKIYRISQRLSNHSKRWATQPKRPCSQYPGSHQSRMYLDTLYQKIAAAHQLSLITTAPFLYTIRIFTVLTAAGRLMRTRCHRSTRVREKNDTPRWSCLVAGANSPTSTGAAAATLPKTYLAEMNTALKPASHRW